MGILVIEDDLLQDCLAHEGFEVELAHAGAEGLERSLSGEHAFVILDINLPGINGFEVLSRIRRKSDIPVLMLTAFEEDNYRVKGLEMVRRVQGRKHNPYDRSIHVHISHLRKKLTCHGDGSERIKVVRGVGHFYSLPASQRVREIRLMSGPKCSRPPTSPPSRRSHEIENAMKVSDFNRLNSFAWSYAYRLVI